MWGIKCAGFSCHFMKEIVRGVCLAIVFAVCIGKADDNSMTRQFIESCYGASRDSQTEMTDVILVNAYYTNQDQIKHLADAIVDKRTNNANLQWGKNLLGDIFSTSSMSKNANIKLFRERMVDNNYRLDTLPNLGTFRQYQWDGGQFTNKYKFSETEISIPPSGTNNFWTLYDALPDESRIAISKGVIPRTDFYIHLYSLPSQFEMNVMLQTADIKAAKATLKAQDITERSPADYSWFKINETRLADALGSKGSFKYWSVRPLLNDVATVKQLSVIGPDGIDHDKIRVIFNGFDPKQRYLAYMRGSDGAIVTLFAWDYGENGYPIRFMRVENQRDALVAWAQNIVYVGQTTNIDWSLYHVDTSKFTSVYDKRPEYPIQTVNGKIVFNAKTNSYASFAGSRSNSQSGWFSKPIIIRIIMICILLLPLLFLIWITVKKRATNNFQ